MVPDSVEDARSDLSLFVLFVESHQDSDRSKVLNTNLVIRKLTTSSNQVH